MGDMLLRVGYQESDTIDHGHLYYIEALKYYLIPMKIVKEEYYSKFRWLEDRVLLLLVLMGSNISKNTKYGTVQAWCEKVGSRRFHFLGTRRKLWGLSDEDGNTPLAPPFVLGGYGHSDDRNFQAIMILSEMKLLANYRQSQAGIEAYEEGVTTSLGLTTSTKDVLQNISPFLMGDKNEMETLPERIETALFAIRHHGYESLLSSIIAHDKPIQSAHPKLFRASLLASNLE